jgi:hypothetical protein
MTMDLEGNRKLLACALAILSASALVALGKISDGVYSTVMLCAVGGYLAANVTQAMSLGKKES